jgi:hypothetical protein
MSLECLHVFDDLTWKVIKVTDCYQTHKGTGPLWYLVLVDVVPTHGDTESDDQR